jgi:hypothetical protein
LFVKFVTPKIISTSKNAFKNCFRSTLRQELSRFSVFNLSYVLFDIREIHGDLESRCQFKIVVAESVAVLSDWLREKLEK